MDVHIHANCQSIPIAAMLLEACPDWNVTWFEVHGAEIMDRLDEHCRRVKTADLVLTQPIHKGYRDTDELSVDWVKAHARRDATVLVFPSMHFAAHHPDLGFLPFPGLPHLCSLLAAHLVAAGCSESETLGLMLSEHLLRDSEIETELEESLTEASRRDVEDSIDIKIGSFIGAHYRIQPMFHIQNHPLRYTAAFITNQILERIGVAARVDEAGEDYQPNPHVPPLPAISSYLARQAGANASSGRPDTYVLHGYPQLTASEYFALIIEGLRGIPASKIYDAIAANGPSVQFFRRLAEQKSSIPRVGQWL